MLTPAPDWIGEAFGWLMESRLQGSKLRVAGLPGAPTCTGRPLVVATWSTLFTFENDGCAEPPPRNSPPGPQRVEANRTKQTNQSKAESQQIAARLLCCVQHLDQRSSRMQVILRPREIEVIRLWQLLRIHPRSEAI